MTDLTRDSGPPQVGDVLEVSPGTWQGDNITYSYQWGFCNPDGTDCHEIDDQTDTELVVQPSEIGYGLGVMVTANSPCGDTTAYSNLLDAVVMPAGPAGPAGPQGPAGATGPQGQPGTSNGATTNSSTNTNSSSASASANGTSIVTVNAGSAPSGSARSTGGPPCSTPTLFVSLNGRGARVAVPFGQRVLGHGYLTCSGRPIRAAHVTMTGGGLHGSFGTGSAGGFAFTIRAGRSRIVTFRYAPAGRVAATTTAHIMVAPAITLSIRQHRTGRLATTCWHGNVRLGARIPASVALLAQKRTSSGWITVGHITARHGTFRYTYRYRASGTVSFRVALAPTETNGLMFAPAHSSQVHV